jgi:transposase
MTSQIERVQKVLARNVGKNISADRVAKAAKVPLDSVYRRVYDLRKTGFRVTTTSKTVKGTRQQFYSVA